MAQRDPKDAFQAATAPRASTIMAANTTLAFFGSALEEFFKVINKMHKFLVPSGEKGGRSYGSYLQYTIHHRQEGDGNHIRAFSELLKLHETLILSGTDGWIKEGEIEIKVPKFDEEAKYLPVVMLSKYYNAVSNIKDAPAKEGILKECQITLYRIFYCVCPDSEREKKEALAKFGLINTTEINSEDGFSALFNRVVTVASVIDFKEVIKKTHEKDLQGAFQSVLTSLKENGQDLSAFDQKKQDKVARLIDGISKRVEDTNNKLDDEINNLDAAAAQKADALAAQRVDATVLQRTTTQRAAARPSAVTVIPSPTVPQAQPLPQALQAQAPSSPVVASTPVTPIVVASLSPATAVASPALTPAAGSMNLIDF